MGRLGAGPAGPNSAVTGACVPSKSSTTCARRTSKSSVTCATASIGEACAAEVLIVSMSDVRGPRLSPSKEKGPFRGLFRLSS